MNFRNHFELFIESKQNILNLGYPQEVVDQFFQNWKDDGYVVGRWMKEYYHGEGKGWFRNLPEMNVTIEEYYEKMIQSASMMNQFRDRYEDYFHLTFGELLDMQGGIHEESYKMLIRLCLFEMEFFGTELGQTCLNSYGHKWLQYKKLSYSQASAKWDKVIAFEDYPIVYAYNDGWCWRKLESSNSLVAELMSNCGDTGGSYDNLVVLFDNNKKPRVLGSLEGNFISNVVGRGESEIVKPTLLEKLQEVLVKKAFKSDQHTWYKAFPNEDPDLVNIMYRLSNDTGKDVRFGIQLWEYIYLQNKRGVEMDQDVNQFGTAANRQVMDYLDNSFEETKKKAIKRLQELKRKYK